MYADGDVMVEFGQQLRRARENQGVPVEAVCAITKVAMRHVEALESGHLEELPGGVFRKGIVRSYVAALGLDEAEWVERFEACLRSRCAIAAPDQEEWAAFAENVKRNRAEPRSPTGMRWLGVALLFLLLLICGWLAWRYAIRDRLGISVKPGLAARVAPGRAAG